MDNRRLFLAFLLSMIVIFGWYTLFPPKKPAPVPEAARQEGTAPPPAAARGAAPASPSAPAPLSPAAPRERLEAAGEERVVLEGGGQRAVFTNRGAQLVSFEVRDTAAEAEPEAEAGRALDLVRSRKEGPWPYGLTNARFEPHPLNQALFTFQKGAGGRGVVFRYSGPAGQAEKTFRLNEQGLLEVDVKISGPERWGLLVGPGVRNPTAEELKSQYERRAAVYLTGGEVERLDAPKAEETVEVPGRGLSWVGLEDTYFLSAVIPRAGLDRAVLRPVLIEPGDDGARFVPMPAADALSDEQEKMTRELALVLEPEADGLSLVSYWGSKQYERLANLPYGLEKTVDFGMFGVLARPLLAALHWIYDHVVANYGWAIILLTIVIKILLLPLTHKSMMSMRKMQELNPKVQRIRDKYRTKLKDKQGRPNIEMQQQMNQEMMGLYKEHGVNPAGGCLPILLQMPILFAFYRLLSAAAELRGAPWMLWVQDLSVQDPYYVLPIVMGATQFLQVRMAPPAGDPMQRRIFQLMPIFMTFLFLGVPSGLVLYWLTNNVLTIVQQGVYNRLWPKEQQ
ncbi:MAG TPA: membrane protein insertase YidC [Thermoanaerobaculia bacterium]|nr:membrane protein insertase YidC [Thermoanaerobaculia bacterium]